MSNPIQYFSYVGSYEGAIKLKGKWIRYKNLNYIDKNGWIRILGGDMTKALEIALKFPIALDGKEFNQFVSTITIKNK